MHYLNILKPYVFLIQDWFEQFKEQILEAEQLLLTALDFELTVEHPYKILMTVFSMNGLLHSPISEMAMRLVNDG